MLATNFGENSIEKTNEVLKFVLENKHSDFYKKKYGDFIQYPIKSYENFQKIPFLTKDDILGTDIEKRTFVSPEEVFSYSFSSGTTKQTMPTIIPHSFPDENTSEKQYDVESFKKLGVSKMLLLLPPSHGLVRNSLSIKNSSIRFIIGDIHNMKLAATTIGILNIDAVTTTPTLLDILIENMTSQKISFEKIKWVSLGAEFCSTVRYNYFKSIFSNASFQMRYGGSEFGPGKRHYRCQHLEESGVPNVFHVNSSIEIIEIMDEQGNTVSMGEPGEIVATDLRSKAFPLIRYKLKDIGSLSDVPCPCGNNIRLVIDGRAGFDVFKIHGMTLYAELIDEALLSVSDVIEPKYQMHVFEDLLHGKPKIRFQLQVVLKKSSENKKEDIFLIEFLKEKISSQLQLSGKMTLKQFVEEGIVFPLEIKFVDSIKQEGAKSKNIISHIT